MYANLLFHGKTYYEQHYNATLLSDDDNESLEKFKNNWNNKKIQTRKI